MDLRVQRVSPQGLAARVKRAAMHVAQSPVTAEVLSKVGQALVGAFWSAVLPFAMLGVVLLNMANGAGRELAWFEDKGWEFVREYNPWRRPDTGEDPGPGRQN